MKKPISVAASAAAALLIAAAPQSDLTTAVLSISLRPVSSASRVSAVDVSMKLSGGRVDGFTLTAPVVYPGVTGVADRMQDIHVTDALGDLPLTVSEDPPVGGGFPYFRHWKAQRAVRYPVELHYRALVQPPGGSNGPPFGMRAVGGGVTGSGATFLLLPDTKGVVSTGVHWDLGELPKGSVAATSFGEGDFTMAGSPARLTEGWYLAGPAGRYPSKGSTPGFSAFWLGTPTFDAPSEMAWTARGHSYLTAYFPHLKSAPPYRVFMRFLSEQPFGGGTALDHSFMLSRGPLKPNEPPVAPRITLFHEMIHQWTGVIDAPDGISSWYSEGLTTYYQELLPLRGGFQSVEDFGKHINAFAKDYYTNPARNWSAAKIKQVGFGDETIRHLPYMRSALYLYDLDARIRTHSRGRRTLQSMLFPMFVAREKGMHFDHAKWIEMVTRELGPGEKERFERLILDGTDTLDVSPHAFGPCFRKEATVFTADDKAVPGYQWTRVPGVADARCRKW